MKSFPCLVKQYSRILLNSWIFWKISLTRFVSPLYLSTFPFLRLCFEFNHFSSTFLVLFTVGQETLYGLIFGALQNLALHGKFHRMGKYINFAVLQETAKTLKSIHVRNLLALWGKWNIVSAWPKMLVNTIPSLSCNTTWAPNQKWHEQAKYK